MNVIVSIMPPLALRPSNNSKCNIIWSIWLPIKIEKYIVRSPRFLVIPLVHLARYRSEKTFKCCLPFCFSFYIISIKNLCLCCYLMCSTETRRNWENAASLCWSKEILSYIMLMCFVCILLKNVRDINVVCVSTGRVHAMLWTNTTWQYTQHPLKQMNSRSDTCLPNNKGNVWSFSFHLIGGKIKWEKKFS